MRGSERRPIAVATALVTLVLTGCSTGGMTEYRGPDAPIDGVLWRLVSSAEDPLHLAVSRSLAPRADAFFEGLPAEIWDGSSETVPDLDEAVAVVYDVKDTGDGASFSVFVSSGQRPDVPTDRGDAYQGPDSVFTCFGYRVEFGQYAVERAEVDFYSSAPSDCPAELIESMPGVVAFAEPLVFSG